MIVYRTRLGHNYIHNTHWGNHIQRGMDMCLARRSSTHIDVLASGVAAARLRVAAMRVVVLLVVPQLLRV